MRTAGLPCFESKPHLAMQLMSQLLHIVKHSIRPALAASLFLLFSWQLYGVEREHLDAYVVDPLAGQPILPDTKLPAAAWSDTVSIALTPGEYEPGSVVLTAKHNLFDVTLEVTTLQGPDGATLPPSAVDIRLVKCWFQYGRAYEGLHTDRECTLVPELLLKDNRLVTVDVAGQFQTVRMGGPGCLIYKDLEDPSDPYKDKNRTCYWGDRTQPHLEVSQNPIDDAAELQPFNLNEGFNQQLLITVHAPEDAAPGVYSGSITVNAIQMLKQDNFTKIPKPLYCGEIGLNVRILPFKLDAPKTHYDPSLDFTPSIYYCSVFAPWRKEPGLCPGERSREQYRAELADLKAHGIINPICFQMDAYDLDVFREALRMRKDAGLINRPLYSMPEANLAIGKRLTPENQPLLDQREAEILRVVEEELGHRDVYFYGLDEQNDVEEEYPVWRRIHENGARVFVSDAKYPEPLAGAALTPPGLLDLVIRSWIPENQMADYARLRHERGGKVWCYGMPQGGVENPELYRRNYGIQVWLANYDGFATYCYYETFGHPWNDRDGAFRDHNLVYPTVSGIVPTLAWEGMREAVDDVRYFTTLARLARERKGSPAAKEAMEFLEGTRPQDCDLQALRQGCIERILTLMNP